MIRNRCLLMLGVLVFGLTGCFDFRYGEVFWAPNGTHAFIHNEETWYFTEEPEYTLTQLDNSIINVGCFPKSSQVAIVRSREYQDWDSLEPILNPTELESVTQSAEKIKRWIAEHPDAASSSWNLRDFLPPTKELAFTTKLLLRDTASEDLKTALGPKWDDIENQSVEVIDILIAPVKAGSKILSGSEVLISLLHEPDEDIASCRLYVDPTERFIAFQMIRPELALDDSQFAYNLYGCEINHPGKLYLLDQKTGYHMAWRPDGKQIAYFRYSGEPPADQDEEELVRLGNLMTLDLTFDENGNFIPEKNHPVEQVGVLFHTIADVAYSPDGSIFFLGLDVHLPTTAGDMPQEWTLFRWDPRFGNVVQQVFNRQENKEVDMSIFSFDILSLSPSGQRIMLKGNESILIYQSETRSTQILDQIDTEILFSQPTWLTENEIAAVVKPGHEAGSPNRSELVVFHLKSTGEVEETRCLSRNWTDDQVAEWFDFVEPESSSDSK